MRIETSHRTGQRRPNTRAERLGRSHQEQPGRAGRGPRVKRSLGQPARRIPQSAPRAVLVPAASTAIAEKPRKQGRNVLTIPHFTKAIPSTLFWSGQSGAGNTAVLAEALLDAGVLCEMDWSRNLSETIHRGLNRWANVEMGCAAWRHFELALICTDDVGDPANDYEGNETIECPFHVPDNGASPVGFFGLYHSVNSLPEACVGNCILDIENKAPGAGYSIMGVIEWALRETVGAIGPRWAYYECWEQWENNAEEVRHQLTLEGVEKPTIKDIEESFGYPSPQTFYKSCPKRAFGNYGPGRFGWVFENIQPLKQPLPYMGARQLFDVEIDPSHYRISDSEKLENAVT